MHKGIFVYICQKKMRKFFTLILTSFLCCNFGFSQLVNYIPDSTHIVFEYDLHKITEKISPQSLDQYKFINEIFNNLTKKSDQTVDFASSGLDFDKKIYVAFGERQFYSFKTIIIPIKDKNTFGRTYDIQPKTTVKSTDTIYHSTVMTTLKKQVAIISVIEWNHKAWVRKAKAIIEKNNLSLPYFYYYSDSPLVDYYPKDSIEAKQVKKFKHVLDSVKAVSKSSIIGMYVDEVRAPKGNFYASNGTFREVCQHAADIKFYMDYRGLKNSYALRNYFLYHFVRKFSDLWDGVEHYSYLNFTNEGINVDYHIKGPNDYMQIVNAAANNNFNSKLLKYVPTNSKGFLVWNANTFGVYQKLKEKILPKLDSSKDGRELLTAAIWHTIDEYVNVKNVTATLLPNTLFTYSGTQKVKLHKKLYKYDDETFESKIVDTTYFDEIPIGAFVFYSDKSYLLEKYLKAFEAIKTDSTIIHHNGYYEIQHSLGFPYYIEVNNNITIITNDKNMVEQHKDGYSKFAFDEAIYKQAENPTLFYGHGNIARILDDFYHTGGWYSNSEFSKKIAKNNVLFDLKVVNLSQKELQFNLNIKSGEQFTSGLSFLLDFIEEMNNINR